MLPFFNVVFGVHDVLMDIVYLFPLGIDKDGQLIKQLNTLLDRGLQFLNISELVLDVADCVLEGDTGISINLFLKHFLGQVRIIDVLLNFILADIAIYESYLSGDLVLDSDFELLFEVLLLFEHLGRFFAQADIEVLFHSRLRFVLN